MNKRRLIGLLMAMAICLALPLAALADVPATHMPAFYVNDFADVINETDAQAMIDLGTLLEDETTAQVVVVTVAFLDGLDIEEYAYQLFTNWQLGQADDQNGVLFLMSIGDRVNHIMVGSDLESKLPPSVTGTYQDLGNSYFADNDYSAGIRVIYEALTKKVASIYGKTLRTTQQSAAAQDDAYYEDSYTGSQYSPSSEGGWGGFMGIIIGIIVLVVIISIVGSLLRSAGNASGCLFGWMLGRGSRGSGYSSRRRWMPPPPPPRGGGRAAPRGGRSTGSFGGGSGGFGGFGGGRSGGFGGSSGRSGGSSRPSGGGRSSGPRTGGGGGTRGGGSTRKF